MHVIQQSKNLKKYYRKDIILTPDFFSSENFKGMKFDLITSIAMFYDLPDPLKFAMISQVFYLIMEFGI